MSLGGKCTDAITPLPVRCLLEFDSHITAPGNLSEMCLDLPSFKTKDNNKMSNVDRFAQGADNTLGQRQTQYFYQGFRCVCSRVQP